MILNKKIEVISFKDFMSRPAASVLKKTPHTNIVYSLLPGASIEGFFNMPPEVAGAYAVVLGVGALAFLSGVIGNKLAESGMEHITIFVEGITKVLLPAGTYAFIGYFLLKLIGGV